MLRTVLLTVVLALTSSRAPAQIAFWTQSPGIPGYVTNDLWVTGSTPAQLMSSAALSQLVIRTDQPGQIFQHQLGGNTSPVAALLGAFPDLAFDTFVARGSTVTPGPYGDAQVIGGADILGNLGAPLIFTEDQLDVSWLGQTAIDLPVQPPAFMARVTLAEDANGSATVLASIWDQPGPGSTHTISDFSIVNGSIVPEPRSVPLVLVSLLCFGRRFFDS